MLRKASQVYGQRTEAVKLIWNEHQYFWCDRRVSTLASVDTRVPEHRPQFAFTWGWMTGLN